MSILHIVQRKGIGRFVHHFPNVHEIVIIVWYAFEWRISTSNVISRT